MIDFVVPHPALAGLIAFVPEMIQPTFARRLLLAAEASPRRPALLDLRGDGVGGVDESQRRSAVCDLPSLLGDRLVSALSSPATLDALAEHFGEPLSGMQPVQILRYDVGGHFARHHDRAPGQVGPPSMTSPSCRRLSMSIFLNDDYQGGSLQIVKEDGSLVVQAEPVPGSALVFKSDLLHIVTPVKSGIRYTAVAWYF